MKVTFKDLAIKQLLKSLTQEQWLSIGILLNEIEFPESQKQKEIILRSLIK